MITITNEKFQKSALGKLDKLTEITNKLTKKTDMILQWQEKADSQFIKIDHTLTTLSQMYGEHETKFRLLNNN